MSPWHKMPDGTMIHIKMNKRPVKRCRWCDLSSVALCDYPNAKRKSGTCDAPMCEIHQTSVGPDQDHCPDHRGAKHGN